MDVDVEVVVAVELVVETVVEVKTEVVIMSEVVLVPLCVEANATLIGLIRLKKDSPSTIEFLSDMFQ